MSKAYPNIYSGSRWRKVRAEACNPYPVRLLLWEPLYAFVGIHAMASIKGRPPAIADDIYLLLQLMQGCHLDQNS